MFMPRALTGAVLLAACVSASARTAAQTAPAAPAPVAPPTPATLTVPAGFTVSVFASGLAGARLMAVSPEGIVVVARRADVVALPDANHDGVAEPRVLLGGLTYAHSVAFRDGSLYIGTTAAVLRAKWSAGAIAGPVETYVTLPSSTPALHLSLIHI